MDFDKRVDLICEDESTTVLRKCQLTMFEMLKEVHRVCIENEITYWLDSGTLLGAVRHKGFIPWDDDIDICMPREDYEKFLKLAPDKMCKGLYLESHEKNFGVKFPWCRVLYLERFAWQGNYSDEESIGLSIDVFPLDLVDEAVCNSRYAKVLNKMCIMKSVNNPKSFKDKLKNKIVQKEPVKLWKRYCDDIKKKNRDIGYSYGADTPFLNWGVLIEKKEVFPLKQVEFEGTNLYAPNNYHQYLKKLYGDYMTIPKEEDRVVHTDSIRIV